MKCWMASRLAPVEMANYRLAPQAITDLYRIWLYGSDYDLARSRHLEHEIKVKRIVAA